MVRYLSWHLSLLAVLATSLAEAARPSPELLPVSTKGFLSIPDLADLQTKWQAIQLGQMVNDPQMKPFVADIRRQLNERMDQLNSRLGVKWEFVQRAAGGEICLAIAQPWDQAASEQKIKKSVERLVAAAKRAGRSPRQIKTVREKAARSARRAQERLRQSRKALVMLVDVTGHPQEAAELVADMERNLRADGGQKSTETFSEVTVVRFTFPLADGQSTPQETYYCLHNDQLIAVDNRTVAQQIMQNASQPGTASESQLAQLVAFREAMQHSQKALGVWASQIRWFVEPFGYVEVSRAYRGGRKKRGTDLLKILSNQGFDAIQGLGGHIALSTPEHEILHRSFLYAPAVKRQPGEAGKGRYDLAANMLDFPNKLPPKPPHWLPKDVATYVTFSWRMRDAFEHASTLVDEIAGDVVFEDVLKSIKNDPNGPQVDIRKNLVGQFAERATLVADYRQPITPQCERILFAIELTDPAIVSQTIDKAMDSDPAAKKRNHNGHAIWEILNEDPVEVETLKIDDPNFGFGFDDPEPAGEDEEPFIPNSAITVVHGHLLIASHIDYIQDVLDLPADAIGLEAATDYQAVQTALDALGAGKDSFRFFTRTEQAFHPTYELIRQGKMPEAETMLGRLINRILGADEDEGDKDEDVREQFIDNTNMPAFDVVRKYLGPSGTFIRTEEAGWSISGCLLKKQ